MNEQYRMKTSKEDKVKIVSAKLDDMLDQFGNFTHQDIINGLLDLKGFYGDDIFELDGQLHFTLESIDIFEAASSLFFETLEALQDDLELSDEEINNIKTSFLSLLKAMKNDIVHLPKAPTRFITIPVDGLSIIDFDLEGKSVRSPYGGRGSKPPRDYKIANNKHRAEVVLRELNQIEKTFQAHSDIKSVSRPHGTFQGENDGTYVKRNTSEATRTLIGQYQPGTIIVYGLFHKDGQNDPRLQDEYTNRRKMLDEMHEDISVSLNDCEQAYRDLKTRVIKAVYGKQLSDSQAVCTYIVDKARRQGIIK